jgi:hypothetical protein
MATDAARKELDGLLNTGRQACGSLQIAGSSNLSAIALTQKLLLVPGLMADWKQSSARGGVRTALTLAKAHYPEMDLDLLTSGIPESGEDGVPVDEAAIRQSVLGYVQLSAKGRQARLRRPPPWLLQVVMAVTRCPPRFRRLLRMCPAIWQEKIICINSAPEWVCNLNLNCV